MGDSGVCEGGQEVGEGACLVEDGRAPDEGTLTEVARFCGAVLGFGGAGGRSQGLER